MVNEFKYGQTWKILPSPLSLLSLYSTFKYAFDKYLYAIQVWENKEKQVGIIAC